MKQSQQKWWFNTVCGVAFLLSGTQAALAEDVVVYDSWNGDSVYNNPPIEPVFTLTAPTRISEIVNYHWNYFSGQNAALVNGAIGIDRVESDTVTSPVGRWPATSGPGGFGSQNTFWYAYPNIVLGPGNYKVVDSDRQTWSYSVSNYYHIGNDWAPNKGFSQVISSGPACTTAAQGMIGWWPGDGNGRDLINNHHGVTNNEVSFPAGQVAQSFNLGASGYIRVPNSPTLNTPNGFTIDTWINPSADGGAQDIASKWDDPTGQWSWIFKLHNDGSRRLRIEISRGGDHNALGDLEGTTVLPLNTWSHVAATYDRASGLIRLYVNGVVDGETSARFPNTAINNSATDILIGAVNGQISSPGEFFQGMIDEVELYNRALTPDELAAIFAAGNGGTCKPTCATPPQGMIGWWPGDGNTNDLVNNHPGVANNEVSYPTGQVAQSFNLGAGGYVRIPNSPTLNTPNGFTIDTWINPSGDGGAQDIASKWDDPTGQWSWIFKLHNDGSRRLRIEISRGGDHNALGDLEGTTVLPLNTWSHVAATYDRASGLIRLYVNGVVDGETSARFPNTPIGNSATDILIGAVNGQTSAPGEFFQGMIDEVELYNRALTPDELAAIFAMGNGGTCKTGSRPPVAEAGPDRILEMTSCVGANVRLNGSGSTGANNGVLDYAWNWPAGNVPGVRPTMTLPLGSTEVSLTVADDQERTSTDMTTVTVADTTAPALRVKVTPNVLSPPNHKYVRVVPTISVADACTAKTTTTLVSVTSNEPDNGLGDGDQSNDIVINSDGSISLRAERSGKGSGRVYTLTYQATDSSGNHTTASAFVTVPH